MKKKTQQRWQKHTYNEKRVARQCFLAACTWGSLFIFLIIILYTKCQAYVFHFTFYSDRYCNLNKFPFNGYIKTSSCYKCTFGSLLSLTRKERKLLEFCRKRFIRLSTGHINLLLLKQHPNWSRQTLRILVEIINRDNVLIFQLFCHVT